MKKSLSQAIALATLFGAAASAHAVNVTPDGLGNALLYSLYTTEAGKQTAINVTNTTGDYKAVKVRFLEGLNSKEVLDFNLYLSPYDQWGATVVQNPETGGAMLQPIADTSCTAPDMNSAFVDSEGSSIRDFKDYAYKAYPDATPKLLGDGGRQDITRTRVGHVEIIEMGVVDPALGAATIEHNENGVPANCDALRARWAEPNGVWFSNPLDSIGGATGGLYGTASIIDPLTANVITYDAVAIDNFYGELPLPYHTATGSLEPNLNDADKLATFPDGQEIEFDRGVDAVSAVLMKSTIQNDYLVGEALKGETNWVVTFPTKNLYVNQPVAVAPFTSTWGGLTGAPEELTYNFWDNEEREAIADPVDLPDLMPSPLPPNWVQEIPGTFLRWETNIIKFDGKDVLASEYENLNLPITELSAANRDSGFNQGWVQFDFSGHEMYGFGGEGRVEGLPVIGFSAITMQNGYTGQAGAIANFSGQYQHKATTNVDQDATAP